MSAFGWAASPVDAGVVPVFGGGLRLTRSLGAGAASLEAEADFGASDANAEMWRLSSRYAVGTVGIAAGWRLGVGELWASARAGARLLYELQERHSARRLSAAGIEASSVAGWFLGPIVGLRAGATTSVVGGMGVVLGAGPTFGAVVRAGGKTSWATGWDASAGVVYAW